MTNKTVEYTSVHPSVVRAFAVEKGEQVGERGRYSEALVKAFNKGKRGHARYDESKTYAPHVTVTVKPKGKPPVRKTFAAPVLRAEMAAAGLVSPTSRGRIPSQKAKDYVLSTLS